jgi:hypothetical protein
VIVLQLDVDPCPSPRTDPSGDAAMRQLAESDERVISFFQGDADGKTP